MRKSHFLYVPDHVVLDQQIRYLLARNFILDNVPTPSTDYIFVAGGDRIMLRAARLYWDLFNSVTGKPVLFGLNYGHIGFLANQPSVSVIQEIERGEIEVVKANLLKAEIEFENGERTSEFALNDFYFRAPEGTTKVRVTTAGKVRYERLVCDGIIVSSALGSTAYNASVGGPILPYDANDRMVVSAIASTLFSGWKNRSLKRAITIDTLETEYSLVNFYADGIVYQKVKRATIRLSDKSIRIAYANSQKIRQRQLRLQKLRQRNLRQQLNST